MTFKVISQEKRDVKRKIIESLIQFNNICDWSQIAIARKLGYEKDVFASVKSDENYYGSPQLLAGLSLLIELETLKKEIDEVRAAKRAIQQIMAPTGAFMLSEPSKTEETKAGAGGQPPSYLKPRRKKFSAAAAADAEVSQILSKKGRAAK